MPAPDASIDPLDRAFARAGSAAEALTREQTMFASLARGARKAVIMGYGHLGRIVVAGARDAGLEIAAITDNRSPLQGSLVDGIPVLSPADAVARHNHDAFFVVAIYNGSAPRQQLRALGCDRIVPYPAFYWEFSRHLTAAPGLDLPHAILASRDAIRAGYQCLHDERSREEFAAQIAWRCTLDYTLLPPQDPPSDTYFPRRLMHLSAGEVLVDCGAFDGDSVRLLLDKTGGGFRHIYACEPDAANRAALGRYLESLPPDQRDRVSILPFAIGDRDGVAYFDASGTAGSRLSGAATREAVECRRLDTLLSGAAPTIIKMDIEGAEPLAIRGAEATLRRARPILSVCAYHVCDHLWTLPALIKEIQPEYRVSLRRYAEECWETVYYAIPPERAIAP